MDYDAKQQPIDMRHVAIVAGPDGLRLELGGFPVKPADGALAEAQRLIAGRDGWRATARPDGVIEVDVRLADGRRFIYCAPPGMPARSLLDHVEREVGWDPPIDQVDVACMRCRVLGPDVSAIHTAHAHRRMQPSGPAAEWIVVCRGTDVSMSSPLPDSSSFRPDFREQIVSGLARRLADLYLDERAAADIARELAAMRP